MGGIAKFNFWPIRIPSVFRLNRAFLPRPCSVQCQILKRGRAVVGFHPGDMMKRLLGLAVLNSLMPYSKASAPWQFSKIECVWWNPQCIAWVMELQDRFCSNPWILFQPELVLFSNHGCPVPCRPEGCTCPSGRGCVPVQRSQCTFGQRAVPSL